MNFCAGSLRSGRQPGDQLAQFMVDLRLGAEPEYQVVTVRAIRLFPELVGQLSDPGKAGIRREYRVGLGLHGLAMCRVD
jgi:hypothetical protein